MRSVKKRVLGLAGVVALSAAMLVTGSSVAMSDTTVARAQTEALGSQACGPDQKVYVSVYLNSPGQVAFYQYVSGQGMVKKYTSSAVGSSHTFTYNSRSLDWKVVSNNIATATDGCTAG